MGFGGSLPRKFGRSSQAERDIPPSDAVSKEAGQGVADRLEAVVAAQALEGKTIQSAETDRELLLLADLPAVGKVTGQLLPGRTVGTSDIVITALPGKKYEGDVSLDNYGNRYTGQNRPPARFSLDGIPCR